MILDDGGDLTAMCYNRYPELLAGIRGFRRDNDWRSPPVPDARAGEAHAPCINVNDR
jgi:adenosylhomocysteinase